VTIFKVEVQAPFSEKKTYLETFMPSILWLPQIYGSLFSELFKRNWFQTKQGHASNIPASNKKG